MDFRTHDASVVIHNPQPMESFQKMVDALIQNVDIHGSFMSPALVTESNNLVHLHFETFGMDDADVQSLVSDVLTLAGFKNTEFTVLSNN